MVRLAGRIGYAIIGTYNPSPLGAGLLVLKQEDPPELLAASASQPTSPLPARRVTAARQQRVTADRRWVDPGLLNANGPTNARATAR